MKTVCLFVCLFVICGCARVSIDQTETIAPDGQSTERKTKFRANTFFDSRNELAKARTTMTDKTQGVSISGLEQESSGSNAVSLAEKVVEGAVRGAVTGAKGF
jgi:hypothetical protein